MLNISQLENAKVKGQKTVAACPACREAGHDKQGNHLIIYEGGKFGCAANEGDSDHRKAIFSLVGVKDNSDHTYSEPSREALQATQRREKQALEAREITRELTRTLETRLAPYMAKLWKIDFLDSSPIRFDCPKFIPKDFIQSLYYPEDILWMGDVLDSGKEKHRRNFRTCKEWLEAPTLPPRIAPSTFLQDSFSRSTVNVDESPFIIIESDDIIGHKPETKEDKERNKALSHALTRYAQDKLGLTLRAVIDTGNKSLHAWFDRPPLRALEAIKKMATGLRIDLGALDQGHSPFRMPHCKHDKTNQTAQLLYLNPIY